MIFRKRCDETFPVCLRCTERDKSCTWPARKKPESGSDKILMLTNPEHKQTVSKERAPSRYPEHKQLVSKEKAPSRLSVSTTPNEVVPATMAHGLLPASFAVLESVNVMDLASVDFEAVENDIWGFKEDLTAFQIELEEQKNTELLDEQLVELQKEFHITPVVKTTFLSAFSSKLDSQGLSYLDSFKEYWSFVSIAQESQLRKTYENLARESEPILYSITAMGGFYQELRKEKGDFSQPWLYMQKAAKLMCNLIGDTLKLTNKDDLYVLFAFYMIFICIEVCTGDVRNWGGLLNQCSQLIKSFGGMGRVSEMFNHSTDIKLLISNFQFHDILSSRALIHGTLYSIEEHLAALPEDPTYGIDPLQGIAAPVYYLLGEIGNAKVQLRKKWAVIEDLIAANGEGVHEMRIEYYEELELLAGKFTEKIDAVSPSKSQLDLIKLDQEECEIQIGVFDLYVYICQMQLGLNIKQLPPSSPHQQLLLMKALKLVDFLIPTKAKVALSLLLLVCGMTCVTQLEREQMIQRFRKHLKRYVIGNFQRVEELVEETWARDPDGHQCTDWADLADEKGWNLFVG